jgi:putative aldouronate transport system permease protein
MGGVVIAFQKYFPTRGVLGSDWVGFRNFEFIFRSIQFRKAMFNTVAYSLVFAGLNLFFGVTLAVLLYEIKSALAVKIYQTVLFFPRYLSWVVIGIILYGFLSTSSGLVNRLIVAVGGTKVTWYTAPRAWIGIIPFIHLWHGIGNVTIIYYAALMGLDPQLYEVADLDGATRWQKMWRISFPGVLPVATILLILEIGRLMTIDFGLFYQTTLQSGPLIPTTDVIPWFTFRALFDMRAYGMGAAVGLFQSLTGLVLIATTNWAANRISGGEHGLF